MYVRDTDLVARPFDSEDLSFSGEEISLADGVMSVTGAARAVFSATDEILVFQRGNSETLNELVWFDRKGNRLGTLGDVAAYFSLAISPDGAFVAVPVSVSIPVAAVHVPEIPFWSTNERVSSPSM